MESATSSREASASEGRLTLTVLGSAGLAARLSMPATSCGPRGVRADVQAGGVAVEAEVFGGDRQADQGGPVDLRGEFERAQYPGDGEPVLAQPDPGAGVDEVDAELGRGLVAEHHDRVPGGGLVEEDAGVHPAVERVEQGQFGGADLDATGAVFGYPVGAEHLDLGQRRLWR